MSEQYRERASSGDAWAAAIPQIPREKIAAWAFRIIIAILSMVASAGTWAAKEALDSLKVEVASLKSEMRGIETALSAVDKDSAYQRGRIDGIERRVESNERRIGTLELRIKP